MTYKSLIKFSTTVCLALFSSFIFCVLPANAQKQKDCIAEMRACNEEFKPRENGANTATQSAGQLKCLSHLDKCNEGNGSKICETLSNEFRKSSTEFSKACGNMKAQGDCADKISTCESSGDDTGEEVVQTIAGLFGSAGGMGTGTVNPKVPGCSMYTHSEWLKEKEGLQTRMDKAQEDIIKASEKATENKKDITEKSIKTQTDLQEMQTKLKRLPVDLSQKRRGMINETKEKINNLKRQISTTNIQLADLLSTKAQIATKLSIATKAIVQKCLDEKEVAIDKIKAMKANAAAAGTEAIKASSINSLSGKNEASDLALKKKFVACLGRAKDAIAESREAAARDAAKLTAQINDTENALAILKSQMADAAQNLDASLIEVQMAGNIEEESLLMGIQMGMQSLDSMQTVMAEMNQNTKLAMDTAQQKLMGAQMELQGLKADEPIKGATKNWTDAQSNLNSMESIRDQMVKLQCEAVPDIKGTSGVE